MAPVEVIMRTERKRRFSEAFRQRVVEEMERSDTTIKAIAQKHDITPSLLYKWRERYRAAHDAAGIMHPHFQTFAEPDRGNHPFKFLGCLADDAVPDVDVAPPTLGQVRDHAAFEVQLRNGIIVRLNDHFQLPALSRLLDALERRL